MARGKKSRPAVRETPATATASTPPAKDAQRHWSFGWWGLAIFASLGLALELMHGIKWDFYLDVRHETRRLMWTLAHTHGTVFSFAHLLFAATVHHFQLEDHARIRFAGRCLTGAWMAMPLGFFLGGLWIYGGDPGWGIVLAPVGGLLFIVASSIVGWTVSRQ